MVFNHPVKLESYKTLKGFVGPDTRQTCCGQPHKHFAKMVIAEKGSIIGHDGKVSAFIDNELGRLDARRAVDSHMNILLKW